MFDNCHPSPNKQKERVLPKRIILVRHGESAGNIDGTAYATTPDNRIPLTPLGVEQAERAGAQIYDVISDGGARSNWKVYFYVSPYARTRSTLRGIGRAFPRSKIIGAREECRIREQDFGNFQVAERMKVIKEIRERFGRFFYRFPEGESAADVFDRVSSFLESLWRDIDMNRLHRDPADELNLVIVSHGLAIRVFLMKWFKWTVEQFEHLNNLGNSEFQVMQLGDGGEYSLAVQHSKEKLREWGLSPDMIADQRWRAQANKGDWNDSFPCYLDSFFDNFADSNTEDCFFDSCADSNTENCDGNLQVSSQDDLQVSSQDDIQASSQDDLQSSHDNLQSSSHDELQSSSHDDLQSSSPSSNMECQPNS